jgi:hypothetical protein
MHIASLADRTITISKRTAYLLDAVAAAASLTVDRQPPRASAMRVTVAAGTTGSGTVTITGTVEGAPATAEVLTFTANGVKVGSKLFTAISAVATSGLANEAAIPTVAIEAVDRQGAPQAQDVTRAANVPAQLKKSSGRWPVPASGSEVSQTITYVVDRSDLWTARKGDRITEDANTAEVSIVEEARTPGGPFYGSHVELRAVRV